MQATLPRNPAFGLAQGGGLVDTRINEMRVWHRCSEPLLADGREYGPEHLEYRVDDAVAVLSIAADAGGGPGRLGPAVRDALAAGLERASGDSAVQAVVITGQGRSFPGGLPDDEIADGEAAPTLREICDLIAAFPKPLVAALRGAVRDGGAELALAAQARVAVSGARMVLGDIRRGLIPGAGATQRLPRLVGAGAALDMIFAGRALAVDAPALRGLCDEIVSRNVVGAAAELARKLARDTGQDKAARDAAARGFEDPLEFQAEIAERRGVGVFLPAEAKAALEAVEAAQLLPLASGLAMEASLREDLRGSKRAKGLIRATAAEARGGRASGAVPPDRVTILGDGPTAFGMMCRALDAGMRVELAEQREGGAAQLLRRLDSIARDDEADRQRRARVSGGPSPERLARASVLIEACDAPLGMMQNLAALIRETVPEGAPVLLSSNMDLRAGELRGLLGGPVLGLALSAAPHRAGLAEFAVPGAAPDDVGAFARASALVRRMGRRVVLCPAQDGLITGRLKAAALAAAEWCVAAGASPGAVDAALGWTQGPWHAADTEGLNRVQARFAALGWPTGRGGLAAAFEAAGRSGRISGGGVFHYAQHGASGDLDEAARKIVSDWRRSIGEGDADGDAGAALPPAEIRRRIWVALFAAGMRILDARGADGSADVDLAGLEALGLPRASGGPLKAGELRGLLQVRRDLEDWERDAPDIWGPSERLNEMIKMGEGFGY